VYATDWGTTNLGVWLDDIVVDAGADSSTTGFEDGTLGSWQATFLEESPNHATWPTASSGQTFQEGAVLGTKTLRFQDGPNDGTTYINAEPRRTVYAGFEPGDLPAAEQASFLNEVLEYLAVPDA
jgi:hypothetical protein